MVPGSNKTTGQPTSLLRHAKAAAQSLGRISRTQRHSMRSKKSLRQPRFTRARSTDPGPNRSTITHNAYERIATATRLLEEHDAEPPAIMQGNPLWRNSMRATEQVGATTRKLSERRSERRRDHPSRASFDREDRWSVVASLQEDEDVKDGDDVENVEDVEDMWRTWSGAYYDRRSTSGVAGSDVNGVDAATSTLDMPPPVMVVRRRSQLAPSTSSSSPPSSFSSSSHNSALVRRLSPLVEGGGSFAVEGSAETAVAAAPILHMGKIGWEKDEATEREESVGMGLSSLLTEREAQWEEERELKLRQQAADDTGKGVKEEGEGEEEEEEEDNFFTIQHRRSTTAEAAAVSSSIWASLSGSGGGEGMRRRAGEEQMAVGVDAESEERRRLVQKGGSPERMRKYSTKQSSLLGVPSKARAIVGGGAEARVKGRSRLVKTESLEEKQARIHERRYSTKQSRILGVPSKARAIVGGEMGGGQTGMENVETKVETGATGGRPWTFSDNARLVAITKKDVDSSREGFARLLGNEGGVYTERLRAFQVFCEKEHSPESLLFWHKVETFRGNQGTKQRWEEESRKRSEGGTVWFARANSSALRGEAEDIFNTFIRPQSPLMVNVGSTTLKVLTATVEGGSYMHPAESVVQTMLGGEAPCTRDMFDKAQHEIFNLMFRDTFKRFYGDLDDADAVDAGFSAASLEAVAEQRSKSRDSRRREVASGRLELTNMVVLSEAGEDHGEEEAFRRASRTASVTTGGAAGMHVAEGKDDTVFFAAPRRSTTAATDGGGRFPRRVTADYDEVSRRSTTASTSTAATDDAVRFGGSRGSSRSVDSAGSAGGGQMKGGQAGERRVAAGQGRRSTWRDRAQRRRSSRVSEELLLAGEGHISFDQKKFLKVSDSERRERSGLKSRTDQAKLLVLVLTNIHNGQYKYTHAHRFTHTLP